ncbi:MAG: hypothetical protein MZV70_33010 [Desulfobacterales bacterium]|nr:hypothetical protein [Desulfobacterales bacterium]
MPWQIGHPVHRRCSQACFRAVLRTGHQRRRRLLEPAPDPDIPRPLHHLQKAWEGLKASARASWAILEHGRTVTPTLPRAMALFGARMVFISPSSLAVPPPCSHRTRGIGGSPSG